MSRAHIDYASTGRPIQDFEGFDEGTPEAGFYKMSLRSGGVLVGVRIWHGAPLDPLTGDELDRGWRWQAEVNGTYIEVDLVWPRCAGRFISEAEYQHLCGVQSWAKENAPATAFANPMRKVDPLASVLPF